MGEWLTWSISTCQYRWRLSFIRKTISILWLAKIFILWHIDLLHLMWRLSCNIYFKRWLCLLSWQKRWGTTWHWWSLSYSILCSSSHRLSSKNTSFNDFMWWCLFFNCVLKWGVIYLGISYVWNSWIRNLK